MGFTEEKKFSTIIYGGHSSLVRMQLRNIKYFSLSAKRQTGRKSGLQQRYRYIQVHYGELVKRISAHE